MRYLLALSFLLLSVPIAADAAFAPGGEPRFARATATISTGERKVVLRVEVARTDAQRELGLMHRRSLAPDAGMVFQFQSTTSGPFWMKNTLIPLDIAFYSGRGRILRILQMKPCRVAACPFYDPGVSYRGALEVNSGSFRRWGVRRGDRIALSAIRP